MRSHSAPQAARQECILQSLFPTGRGRARREPQAGPTSAGSRECSGPPDQVSERKAARVKTPHLPFKHSTPKSCSQWDSPVASQSRLMSIVHSSQQSFSAPLPAAILLHGFLQHLRDFALQRQVASSVFPEGKLVAAPGQKE